MATKKAVQDSFKAVKSALTTERDKVAVPAKSVTVVKQKPEKSAKPEKKSAKASDVLKVKKAKLVRDSYAIPDNEYKQLVSLKERCLTHGKALKKGELLRAGIQALVLMKDNAFLEAINRMQVIKAKRPAKAK